ncbi:MAG: hypothetical protein PHY31_07475, partial [Smithellaceae bacterium]|nr:hypothetical protein [Smithellaceae bacterium]
MRKALAIFGLLTFAFLFALFAASPVGAEESGIEVRPTGKELYVTEPGKVITTAFRIRNANLPGQDFIPRTELPPTWIAVTQDFPFTIATGASDIRMVSFLVPQGIPAGTYQVGYIVTAKSSPSLSSLYKISVAVLPVTKLAVSVVESPKYVVAGSGYTDIFAVSNESNVKQTLHLKVRSSEGLTYHLEGESLSLEIGQTRQVKIAVQTDGKIKDAFKHQVGLTLENESGVKMGPETVCAVDVIPRTASGKDESYHEIPAQLVLHGVGDQGQVGFQLELSGQGTYDEEGKKRLSFMLRGPDALPESVFGVREEYSIQLQTKDYDLMLGDGNYTLSPLTETSLYGRGLAGKLHMGGGVFGAYHMETLWVETDRQETAVFGSYSLLPNFTLGLNYLGKSGGDASGNIARDR